eukprot:CCRYP_012896-RB/>CCRYP_012896-RB protein AED:0.15 eAED:0.15 QI:76/0.8/1/1/0/0/6/1310/236
MMQSIINLLISIVTLTKVVECLLTPPDNIGHSLGHHATRRQTLALGSSFSPLSVAESESPRTLIRKGMQSFREGDVSSSLSFFDRADDVVTDGSLRPYLWQRGISYYYLDRFMEGSKQWDIACLTRLDPKGFPPSNRMALRAGKKDRRRIMSTVYSLFRGDGATEHDLAMAGHTGNITDEFYSLFYLGLYCEIRGETSKAESYMKAAASSKYATGPGAGDYMTACARVHCNLRGWV